jgi:cytochrome c biogenesis protein CcdA
MLTIAMGAVLGILVTFSSVGAGAIGVTALLLLYPRIPMAQIVGSDVVKWPRSFEQTFRVAKWIVGRG